MSKYISSPLNTQSFSTTCETGREYYPLVTSPKSIKKKLLKLNTLNPQMNIASPSHALRLEMIKENFYKVAPKSERNTSSSLSCLSHRKKSTSTKSSITQRLTVSKINDEIKQIHQFVQNSPCGYEEDVILKHLRIKQSNYKDKMSSNFSINNNQSIQVNVKRNKRRLVIDKEKDQKWQLFVNTINNPSFGIEGIKKEFPKFISNHSIKIKAAFGQKYESRSLSTTMIALRTDRRSDNTGKFDLKKKNKLTQASRMKLKVRTIKWFIDNKKDLLNRLLDQHFQEQILKFTEKKSREFNSGLTIEEFGNLMQNNKITNDPELIKKLFWIFDEDGDNDLKYAEIASGIEMFRDTTPEEKVKVFFRLCDADHSNSISKKEFYTMLKRNIINKDDIRSLKKSVEKIFNSYGGDVELTLEQLTEGFRANKELGAVLNKNMLSLKTIDSVIDDDVKKEMMKFTADQNLFIKQKLIGGNCENCPIIEKKFGKLVEEFVDNKERKTALNKRTSFDDSDYEDKKEEEDDMLFKEEKKIYNIVMNMKKDNIEL